MTGTCPLVGNLSYLSVPSVYLTYFRFQALALTTDEVFKDSLADVNPVELSLPLSYPHPGELIFSDISNDVNTTKSACKQGIQHFN